MKLATKVAIYWTCFILSVCGLTIAAHATQPTKPMREAVTMTPQPGDLGYVTTAQDWRDELSSFGIDSTGIQIIVTDDNALNCGAAISEGHKGGGCTWHPGQPNAIIFISPIADDHAILHEYAHAKYGVGECAAERFANTVEGYEEFAYPTCAQGIEPAPLHH